MSAAGEPQSLGRRSVKEEILLLYFELPWIQHALVLIPLAMLSMSLFGTSLYLIWGLWPDRDTNPEARRNILLLAVGAVLSGSLVWLLFRTPEARDVTRNGYVNGEDIWKSYERNGVYQLKRDLFYGRAFYPERNENEAFPPWGEPGAPPATRYVDRDPKTGQPVELIPKSIDAFNASRTEWRNIRGLIPKGTKIRMWRVLFHKTLNPDGIDRIYYIGVFVNGPFAGQSLLLNRISIGAYASALSVDSNYLEQVDE